MVVDCIEKKSIKCTQYWPEPTQTAVYRNIEVSCVSQSQFVSEVFFTRIVIEIKS